MSAASDTKRPLRERADQLAAAMSVRVLNADEHAAGVDTIFDLLAEIVRLREALEPMASEAQRGFVAGSWQLVRVRAREALRSEP